jgi:AGZA family xanthine/uracil permease-like MFS transporter
VAGQAFTESKKSHAPAILFGFLPLIAQYVATGVNEALSAAGTSLATIGMESFSASFPIRGVIALSQGAFLSGLLLTAILAYAMDREFRRAAAFALITAACAFVGLIHAPIMSWASDSGVPFAMTYFTLAAICLFIDFRDKRCKNLACKEETTSAKTMVG